MFKNKPEDKYVRHHSDKFVRYEENDEYASFFFDNFNQAIKFINFLPYFHKEYRVRPTRKIGD